MRPSPARISVEFHYVPTSDVHGSGQPPRRAQSSVTQPPAGPSKQALLESSWDSLAGGLHATKTVMVSGDAVLAEVNQRDQVRLLMTTAPGLFAVAVAEVLQTGGMVASPTAANEECRHATTSTGNSGS